ncbi:MAG: rRNA pseudouridine synthase [Nitrospirae bacterium]|nr:rRNA pseudouridine synthase [Nitrospirota bacterium]
MQERLQKIISMAGIASRREAEEIISEGKVTINGKVATIGMKADPEKDHIKVRGKLLHLSAPKVYIVFNKPEKCITALSDPEGRHTVSDFLQGVKWRVFPVGRLDYDSEGLLILTNDGELANAILQPKKKVPKTYQVKISGFLEDKKLQKLRKGIRLDDGMTAPAKAKTVRKAEANSWVELTIFEGRKRQIRRMMERLGHDVIKLKRTRIACIDLGELPKGAFRYLTPDEVSKLKKEVVGSESFPRERESRGIN